jgi:hypothetical protein
MNYLLLEMATASTGKFPVYFVAVYVIGFIACVVIGSIAWYSSKRPPGWEDVQKPDYLPDLSQKSEDNS